MENIADALKISFAVFVFVLAIAITFSTISKAKKTSDVVLYHIDETNFYDYEDSKSTNREVNKDIVISTLYKSCEETITVSIELKDGSKHEFSANTEEEISSFLEDNISNFYQTYVEDFIEIIDDGIYIKGEDGSQITVAEGVKRIYIMYKPN